MLSDKGMTWSGQMEAMTNDGREEGHFYRTIGKPRLKHSLHPLKALKKPSWNSSYLELLPTSRENNPQKSLDIRMSPLHSRGHPGEPSRRTSL